MVKGFVGQKLITGNDGYMRYDSDAVCDYVLAWDSVWADGELLRAYEVFDNLIDNEQTKG